MGKNIQDLKKDLKDQLASTHKSETKNYESWATVPILLVNLLSLMAPILRQLGEFEGYELAKTLVWPLFTIVSSVYVILTLVSIKKRRSEYVTNDLCNKKKQAIVTIIHILVGGAIMLLMILTFDFSWLFLAGQVIFIIVTSILSWWYLWK